MPTVINGTSVFQHQEYTKITDTPVNDATDATYTATACIGGVITRDAGLTNKNDTLPDAASLIAAMQADNAAVGIASSFRFFVYNTSSLSRIDLSGGAGSTVYGAARIKPERVIQIAAVVVETAPTLEAVNYYVLTNSDLV